MWKDYVWNLATCHCENEKFLASIIDDSAITCHEVLKSYDEELKTIPKNIPTKMKRKQSVKCHMFLF